jgi:serine/threonine-protein kinase
MKVISGTHTPVALARFAREAQNALQVESPHVVAVRDVGTRDDGTLYLVMDLVEGPTLSEEKEKFGRLDWALPILYQVAHGLAAVHRAGVVHRDIKPSNVILSYKDDHSNPTAKISDFGVSVLESSSGSWPRDAEGARRLTQTGHVVGTPKYMAPESHGGLGPTGPDSDVFSFGLLAREVLGFAPHHATCPAGLLLLAAPDMSLGSIGDVHPSLEPDVVRVLDDCLKANRKFRPSADEIADTLRGFSSRTDSRPISLGRRERENS